MAHHKDRKECVWYTIKRRDSWERTVIFRAIGYMQHNFRFLYFGNGHIQMALSKVSDWRKRDKISIPAGKRHPLHHFWEFPGDVMSLNTGAINPAKNFGPLISRGHLAKPERESRLYACANNATRRYFPIGPVWHWAERGPVGPAGLLKYANKFIHLIDELR
ncbi:hypothetical protein J6590_039712 [Homalodisca vitripennis]|nr:hypothetical protein J6590_039712 [Homalodisca vitripennis]